MTYKLAILVRSDLKMSRGKVLAQAGHAIVEATVKTYTKTTYEHLLKPMQSL